MGREGVYLTTAFLVAFSVLLFLGVWAAYGVLYPAQGGHHGGGVMVNPDEYRQQVMAFVEANQLEDGSVRPQSSDVYIMAMQFAWVPNVIRLETGREYVLHISSVDVVHGFSLQMGQRSYNATVMPGQVTRVEITPVLPGRYFITCNEYCGLGHEAMSAQFIVEGEPVPVQELEAPDDTEAQRDEHGHGEE